MVRGAFFVLLLLPLLATAALGAPARIALVIGNSDYENAPLKNPANDAALMSRTLRGVGSEVMDFVNLDRREMKRAFARFGKRVKEAGRDTVSLVYYAGHGAQVNGENYLIPVGSLIEDELDVDIEGVRASSLLRTLEEAQAGLNIVILDACRNNPFKSSSRSATRGLAKMDAPTGTLLAYSTAPGRVAEDGTGENSAYTKALSLAIRTPGAKVEEVFKRVRIEVMTRTLDKQVPWESSSLTGDFYFSGGATAPKATASTAPAIQAAPQVNLEAMFWQSIEDSLDAGDYKAYLEQYPTGAFATLARFRAQKLQPTEVAVATPRNTSGDRTIDVLKGYRIWIRSNKGGIATGYCRRLEEAGLIVECDENNTNEPMEDVMLKCATLPTDTGDIIQAYLGIGRLHLYVWRDHEDYGAKEGGNCNSFDAITIDSFAEPKVALGSLAKLRGRNIWVKSNDDALRTRYCRLLEEAGLNVECDQWDSDDLMDDIYLKCPTLPADTGKIVQEILGVSGYDVYDWRDDPDYGSEYCDEYDAITLNKFVALGSQTSAGQGSIEALKGHKIWVRGNKGDVIEGYCRRLEEAGLIVRCWPDDEHDPEDDIILACATLPDDTGEIIQDYLGISGFRIYDWREDSDYGASPGGYCGKFNAIDLSTYE